jgi:hypothetical protein
LTASFEVLLVRTAFRRRPQDDTFENLRPGYALNRPVNKRRPVNGENGEFKGLSEANGLNLHG